MHITMTARRRAALALVACLVLTTLAVLALDRPISTFSHAALARPRFAVWLTWLADAPVPLAMAGLAGAGLAWLAGWQPGHRGCTLLAACIATLLAIEMKNEFKLAAGRLWPETWVANNPSWIGNHAYGFFPFHGGAGWGSFPSGHTTAITAPCAVLWIRVPWLRPVAAGLVGLVVLGLLGADFHWLGDCIAGGFLATACAALVCAFV